MVVGEEHKRLSSPGKRGDVVFEDYIVGIDHKELNITRDSVGKD